MTESSVLCLHCAAADGGRQGAGVRDKPPEQHQADPHRGAQEAAEVREEFAASSARHSKRRLDSPIKSLNVASAVAVTRTRWLEDEWNELQHCLLSPPQ